MVTGPFLILAALILVGAVAAVRMRNLVHCVLAVAVVFVGLAAAYLQLGAQFVGWAQMLIYVGAVAILLVFAVLLTRGGEVPERALFSPGWHWGVTIGAAVFALLAWAIRQSPAAHPPPAAPVQVTVEQIGTALMTHDVLALEVTGLLLTAALIGAVIIAMNDGGPQ